MSLIPGATARAMYNVAVGTTNDTLAQNNVIYYLNNGIRSAANDRVQQIIFETPKLASILNGQFTGLTITTTTDLTPAYKAQLIATLEGMGYLVSTNLPTTVITAVFPP